MIVFKFKTIVEVRYTHEFYSYQLDTCHHFSGNVKYISGKYNTEEGKRERISE